MDKNEVKTIRSQILEKEVSHIDSITETDWDRLERLVQTKFPESYRWFMELMSEYSFPGDILNIRESGRTNGNDPASIVFVAEFRDSDSPWLVPFYAIGNGDYFCFDVREKEKSSVYYYHHEDGRVSRENPSFEDWLRGLPKFLNGE